MSDADEGYVPRSSTRSCRRAKVLRFVQIENKLNTVLSLPGIQAIPLAK